jgi:SOS-response transcriptional repressor LexA
MSTIGERIRKARENKNLLQADLAKLIEVRSSGVISNWEKGLNKPDADKIVRLCAALEISASYLLDYYGNDSFQVSDEEMSHINKYRTLDDHGKDIVDTVLDKEYDRVQLLPEKEAQIIEFEELLEFVEPVSAGFGIHMDTIGSSKPVQVISNIYTRKADYILRVSGNSMEPKYHNGDKILVQEVSDVDIGEIGVWMIDGRGFVKQKADGALLSLNPEYDPIYPMDSWQQVCQGRVLGLLDPAWIVEG